jgi:hypothetical protein
MSAQGPHNVHLVPPTLCSIVVQCLSAFLRSLHNLHNLFLHELHRVQAKHLFCKQNPAAQGARALTYILRIWSAALQGAATPDADAASPSPGSRSRESRGDDDNRLRSPAKAKSAAFGGPASWPGSWLAGHPPRRGAPPHCLEIFSRMKSGIW